MTAKQEEIIKYIENVNINERVPAVLSGKYSRLVSKLKAAGATITTRPDDNGNTLYFVWL